VLDPADVLVDRHPAAGRVLVDRDGGRPGVAEAQEVPGRVDKGVHGVGLPLGAAAAAGTVDEAEAVVELERGLTGRPELDVVGGEDGELVLGHRDHPAVRAVDDRDRAAPEALPAEQPVAEPVVDLAPADPLGLEPLDGLGLGLRHRQPVEPPAVDGRAVPGVGLTLPVLGRLDGADDREAVHPGEVPVALVLTRHGHDRPGSVRHQDVVGQVHRDRPAVEGVEDVTAGEDPAFVQRTFGRLAFDVALPANPLDERLYLGPTLWGGELGYQWMLGGEDGVGHPEAGVRAGGEDPHR